eukprot:14668291-Alexandrium_andersonii.AAC.1
MASPSYSMRSLRRSPWPPPGQRALNVQPFPVAHAAGWKCTCSGPAACARVRRPVGSFRRPYA